MYLEHSKFTQNQNKVFKTVYNYKDDTYRIG